MENEIGRAGFHVVHTKRASERGAILHEMMRELDPESIAYWAARNPSIVAADEALNQAWVNDGEGGFVRCTDRRQVLDYGAERLARVRRKIMAPRVDPATGEEKGGTTTTTMVVSHLPKSLCVEVQDYYPIIYTTGPKRGQQKLDPDGNPRFRSRWVARDLDEAHRYFNDVRDIVAARISPGGQAGILGYDEQHSETTPHVQLLLDAFGDDPDHEGALRADASRFWFGAKGRLAELHRTLKTELIARGWDVSPDFDEDRHRFGGSKAEYAAIEEEKAEIIAALDIREERVDERAEAVRTREEAVREAERALPVLRQRALDEGREEASRAIQEALAAREKAAALQARVEALEVELLERLNLARALLRETTNESLPLAMHAFLDEPLPNGRTLRERWITFSQLLRDDPILKQRKLEAARDAQAARISAGSDRVRDLASRQPGTGLDRHEPHDGRSRGE